METWHGWSVAILVWRFGSLQRWTESPESSGHPFHCSADLDQYARPANWKNRSEHFHGREGRFAGWIGDHRVLVFDPDRASSELHRLLAQCRVLGHASVSARSPDLDNRDADIGRGSDGRCVIFHRRL